jgi:hypothetical protein
VDRGLSTVDDLKSKHPFGTGQLIQVARVSLYGHFDGAGKAFEGGFNLVVLVISSDLDIQIAFGCI